MILGTVSVLSLLVSIIQIIIYVISEVHVYLDDYFTLPVIIIYVIREVHVYLDDYFTLPVIIIYKIPPRSISFSDF